MSVTFHIEIRDADYVGSRIYCAETEWGDAAHGHGSRDFASYDEASVAYRDGLADGSVDRSCCGISPRFSIDTETDAVNLSNTNARDLLDRLGFRDHDGDIDLCGSAEPDALLGRILIARALASDVGIPPATYTGARGAQLLDGGRPEGYFDDKLSRLEALATTCSTLGRKVVWS